MPINKNALLRQQVIDRCLSSGQRYTTAMLLDECNKALLDIGEKPVSSTNTIRTDVTTIITKHHADVVHETSGRNDYYYYRDPKFSIYKAPLKPEELAQLTQILFLLQKFEGFPQMQWLDETLERFQLMLDVDPNGGRVVGFDDNPDLKGLEFFTPLVVATVQKTPLAVHYRSYKGTDFVATVHPYYLKQFNKRWFLFGFNQEYGCIFNFAIDRILGVEERHVPFIENTTIDYYEYFDDMIGVTRSPEAQLQEVKLRISPSSWPYVETKPLHGTQRTIERTPEGGGIISIRVIVNYELEQAILYYGENVEVLAPDSLRDKIKARASKLASLYKD